MNRQIRISPLRVIAPDGTQLGILDLETALAQAEAQGLDLVEVAPMARPPVVRIMDYGKFKFEQAKMARQAKKKQHVIHLKEVKYRPGIDDHDFDTKTRHARRFLEEGNMKNRGRLPPESAMPGRTSASANGPSPLRTPTAHPRTERQGPEGESGHARSTYSTVVS